MPHAIGSHEDRRARPMHGGTIPCTFSLPTSYKDAMRVAASTLGINQSELIRVLIETSPLVNEFLPIRVKDEIIIRRDSK